jgi:hypothetical protein
MCAATCEIHEKAQEIILLKNAKRTDMRTQSSRLCIALALLWSVAGAYAQSSNAMPAQSNVIDSALLAKAKAGDVVAQVQLGVAYDHGDGVPQDHAKAAGWWRKAAKQGNAAAQFNLGQAYLLGRGVAKDYSQAYIWYRKAAEQGTAPAQYQLGGLYYLGQGVSQDYTQAAVWYRKAAEQGMAYAQSSLGYAYEMGHGVPQNFVQAAAWYRKAAEQGDPLGQWSLSSLYEVGVGVAQDYAESYFWLALAASGKIEGVKQEEIDKFRNDVASHLTPADISQVQARASKWFAEHIVSK